jgi:hypothetical protein
MSVPAIRTDSDIDQRVADAEARAAVMWNNEAIAFADLPDRIARTDRRALRDRLLAGYAEALDALEPLYRERLAAWLADGVPQPTEGDPSAMAEQMEPFALLSETWYFAALRRDLALVDSEQGDATIGDLWHVLRGGAWEHWFGARETREAIVATGREELPVADVTGWRAARRMLAGTPEPGEGVVAAAVRQVYGLLVGSPEWLGAELRVAEHEVVPFVDFAAFARLADIRRAFAALLFEQRLYDDPDAGVARAYYAGITGHMLGVQVPEAAYLHAIPRPWASLEELRTAVLAGDLLEVLEGRFGASWWREAAARDLVASVRQASGVDDALARLGYDALDWRPVLRQIRTRLIGEMSGYGGPNITTRAGTRKV